MIRRRTMLLAASAGALGRAARADAAGLRVGDQKGGTQSLMQAAGVLDNLPYQLEWDQFVAAAPLLEALNARAVDAAFAGDAPTTFALAAGLRGHIISPVRTTGAGTAILVPESSAIRAIPELKGRRIATNMGSIGHALVLAVAERQGWSVSDYRLVNLMPADAKLALATGAVDAWSSWGVYVAQARLIDRARVVVDGSAGLLTGLSYLVASDQAISGRRAALLDFCRRLVEARRWAKDHGDDYARALASEIGVRPAVARLVFDTEAPVPVPIDPHVIADEQRTADQYLKAGLLQRKLVATDAFDASFNQALSG